jgi:hypothetical protein
MDAHEAGQNVQDSQLPQSYTRPLRLLSSA